MKKILSFMLSAVMLMTTVFCIPFVAKAQSGSCGENATYSYDISNGTLVISGNGAMNDYTPDAKAPWNNADCINNLKSITISSGITSVGAYAFQQLSQIESISLPNTLKSIGDRAFDCCAVGAVPITLEIPASVETIGECALRGMSKVTAFSVSTQSNYFTTIDGVLYNKQCSVLVQVPCRIGLQSLTLPDTVTQMCLESVYKNYDIKDIYVPAGLRTVGNGRTSIFLDNKSGGITVHYPVESAFDWNVYIKNSNIDNADSKNENDKKLAGICYNPAHCPDDISGYIDTITEPTCTQIGYTVHTCSVCGYSYTDNEKPALEHNYIVVEDVASTEDVAGFTKTECVNCHDQHIKYKPLADHVHNWEEHERVDPTCTENGKEAGRTCLKCGETEGYADIIATGHNFSSEVTEPTCVNGGYTTFTCTVCNYSYKGDEKKSLGHSYDDGKITKESTCIENGKKLYTCQICGITLTKSIAKKSHNYSVVTTKATLTKNGSIVTKCSMCNGVKSGTTTTVIYYPKTIALSATVYNYDGKVKTPAVTVKDAKGKTLVKNTDYTVTYASGRKLVGKYAVKITFKGKYSGTKTLYFTIRPKNTSFSLASGKKAITAKIKKYTTQTTGYQIQYATNSKFTSAKTVAMKNTTTSKTISKLAGGRKYYVRVRTYKTVKINGKNTNIYSAWSSAKAVTTKR